MPFTGRIGTQNSKLGDVVLGIVDAFELATIGFRVHVLSSHEIRVRFDHPVTDSAVELGSYTLSAVGVSPVPVLSAILSAEFYDADRLSVVLKTELPLTYTALYAMTISGVTDFNGQGVSGVSVNFTANAPDPPRAVGAFLSRRGAIDVVFDRPVGSTSPGATGFIRDASGGPATAMFLQPWGAENIPEDTIRFVYPAVIPTADSFLIDYGSVVDQANNVGSGSIPLEVTLRSAPPYNSSSLSVMQFSDAYVVEVVPNLDVATVRVFFNCPANSTESLNLARWTVRQEGPHLHPDTVNPVLVPDAVTAVDAFNILNAIKVTFNDHVIEEPVHFFVDPALSVTAPNAVDLPTAAFLYSDIIYVFKTHTGGTAGKGKHRYDEPTDPADVSITDFATLIALTNVLKFLYNQHLAEERDLPFYVGYPLQIGIITDHAALAKSYAARSKLTYYVDLHVSTAVQSLPIHVLGQIQSEDLGSVTNPADFTGDIMARAPFDPPVAITQETVLDESSMISFDREVFLPDPSSVVVQASTAPLVSQASVTSNLVDAVWFYNSLVYAYGNHIGPAPNGAGHLATETQFFVVPADYMTSTDLPTFIAKVNLFKLKYNGHVQSLAVHIETDETVRTADATDFPSTVALLADLRRVFTAHNSSGTSVSPYDVNPLRPGRHFYPGKVFLVAKLMSSILLGVPEMLDGAVHSVFIQGLVLTWDLLRATQSIVPFSSNEDFLGLSRRPSVASVLPRPGLIFHEDREGRASFTLEPDSLEVYFSKRMHRTELNGGTGSTISVTGGSIILKRAEWVDDRVVSVAVSRMEQISYVLSASGLIDAAGNPLT